MEKGTGRPRGSHSLGGVQGRRPGRRRPAGRDEKESPHLWQGLGGGLRLGIDGGKIGPGGAGPVGSVGGLILGGAAQDEVGGLLGLAGGHDHGAAVVLENPQPAPDVGGGVFQGGAMDAGVSAQEPGAHLGHKFLPAVVGRAEGRPVLQRFPGQSARGAGAVDQLMRQGGKILGRRVEGLPQRHGHAVGGRPVVGPGLRGVADLRPLGHAVHDPLAGLDGIEAVSFQGRDFFGRDPLGLVQVENGVVAEQRHPVLAPGPFLFPVRPGGGFQELPEDHREAVCPALDGPAECFGLVEREEPGGGKAEAGQQHGVDAPVGPAGNQVPGGAAGRVPGLAPGDDSLLQQGDDPVGDQVVDFLAHVVSPSLM